MIPVALSLLVASLVTLAVCARRLIDPACPACSQRAWHGSSALRCSHCGWSNVAEPGHAPVPVAAPTEGLRAA